MIKKFYVRTIEIKAHRTRGLLSGKTSRHLYLAIRFSSLVHFLMGPQPSREDTLTLGPIFTSTQFSDSNPERVGIVMASATSVLCRRPQRPTRSENLTMQKRLEAFAKKLIYENRQISSFDD